LTIRAGRGPEVAPVTSIVACAVSLTVIPFRVLFGPVPNPP
jgi:hypothetical protein